MSTAQTQTPLKERYLAYKAENPGARQKDAAEALGVSEAEVLATGCGENVRRLTGDWAALLGELHRLGRVMTLTRNEHCVHERKGEYKPVEINGHMGIVTDAGIDLRLFMRRWHMGFAVVDPLKDGGERASFQFFDQDGLAIHKVFLIDGSDREAFEEIAKQFLSEDQSQDQAVTPVDRSEDTVDESTVDKEAFLEKWKSLKDTHGFFGLLKKFKVSRPGAMRLAEGVFTRKLENGAYRAMLEGARDNNIPIMCFVGSPGVIQIHTGEVKNLKEFKDWYNVLDPEFNLHLKETGIGETWLVEKATSDGTVTSIELFDKEGREIALFFGARKPGKPELDSWRDLVKTLN